VTRDGSTPLSYVFVTVLPLMILYSSDKSRMSCCFLVRIVKCFAEVNIFPLSKRHVTCMDVTDGCNYVSIQKQLQLFLDSFIFLISLFDDFKNPMSIRIRPHSVNDSLL
jgi:hypothetical protein